MTGWRLGWLLVPTELRRAVDCLTGNFTICPPVLSQIAGVAAFTPEATAEADGNLHHYATNRSLLLDGLRRIGIERLAPTDGAFYVYADVSDYTGDSMAFCSKLLADTGVAVAPGIDFDTAQGNKFIRLSFAGPTTDIEEASAPNRVPGCRLNDRPRSVPGQRESPRNVLGAACAAGQFPARRAGDGPGGDQPHVGHPDLVVA